MRIENLHEAIAYFPDIDGFWSTGDLADAETRIREQLPADWATDWKAQSVELLTQLARVQGMRGDLERAQATIDQSRQMIADSRENFGARAEVRWRLEQGRIFCMGMNLRKANDMFAQAWTQASENGLAFFAIDAAMMLFLTRPPKQQNEWLQRALSLANSSSDKHVRLWISQLLYFEGWTAFDSHQFDKALACFEKAMSEPRATDSNGRWMALQWSRARMMRALGQTEQALEIQNTLFEEMRIRGKVSGYVYLELAECQQLLNQREPAKANFELAFTELSNDPWFADNRSDELNRMKYLFKKR
jgi:tetratricopeptide (TPR) repeat protein